MSYLTDVYKNGSCYKYEVHGVTKRADVLPHDIVTKPWDSGSDYFNRYQFWRASWQWRLSNFRSLWLLYHYISQLRDLKRFGDMTPYRLVNIIVYRVGLSTPRSCDKALLEPCAPVMGACFTHSLIVCARKSPVRCNNTWYKRGIKQSIPFHLSPKCISAYLGRIYVNITQ